VRIFQKCQFVCIEYRMSMKLEGSLRGFLCIKDELFIMIQSV